MLRLQSPVSAKLRPSRDNAVPCDERCCNLRRLTASPFYPEGQTVKATVENPQLFCTDCAAAELPAMGLVFSPQHTLAGPAGFGTMTSTIAATATYTKPLWITDTTHTPHAVPAGKHMLTPKQCTSCRSPRWVLFGLERSKCVECATVF
jgi:hypothetical protein